MSHDRYSRQQNFNPIGIAGQQALMMKHVLIVGAGALGSGNAELLARSGVGTITIIDRDYVEWSNLQRQSLYSEEDVIEQLPKAVAAANRLQQINSDITVHAHVMDCTASDLVELLDHTKVDLMLDATDNFAIRYIMNDVAYRYQIPWIYGACSGSYGAVCSFIPEQTPCLHCVLERMPIGAASCDREGIIAPAVQMVVAMQSAEALKWFSGNRAQMSHRFTVFDLWSNMHQSIRLSMTGKREACPTCGAQPSYPYMRSESAMRTEVLCGRSSVWVRYPRRELLDLDRVASHAVQLHAEVKSNPYLLQIQESHYRLVIFQDGRALIHGTSDPLEAKKLYHRYLT
ncbi:ThiF family adenylyltransferase [Paenibacillus sp. ACRRX]|uniref:ThiF family adenylyltransferase n=1 Tax=Paenibacillus sp. ACRRX TaxID=2918206 RepID=UPI001EF5A953|nr:ThiF family adenylyltransferase [Paenibacillus sp. ACRRX]MCG7406986.1 ThiF family adenylyltransferase [Paenibacillus sp. ACRRX]